MTFFSVVIPTYNRAHCILKTIDSVMQQTFANWELIVVDDGSTDDTATILKPITDPRVRYFYKSNGERGSARNFGAKQAVGEYIFFLDSDDLIKPQYLESAYKHIEKTGTRCLHIPYNYSIDGIEKPGASVQGNPAKFERIQNRFACQVIVHREVMNTCQFSENRDFKIGEDWYFILLVQSKFTFEIGPERLGLIVQHEQRSMVEAPYEVVLQSRDIFEAELQKNLPNDKVLLKNVRHELTNLAALHASIQKQKKTAWKLMIRSIRTKPARMFRFRNLVILKKIILGA